MTRSRPIRQIAVPLALGLAVALAGCAGTKRPTTPTVGNRIPILSRVESGAKVDPSLGQVSVIVPAPQANADWPQAGNTPGKAYGNLQLADTPQRVWSASIAGSSTRQRLAPAPVRRASKFCAPNRSSVWTAGTLREWTRASRTVTRPWKMRSKSSGW